jgi:hypothetical protein
MQVQAQHISVMTYPIQELDELENVIEASRRMLQTLEHRRDRMLQELDQLTRPIAARPTLPTKWISPRVEFKGQTWLGWNFIDLYASALEFLWQEFPHLRHEMATAMAACGHTRKYVSTAREDLFSGQSATWTVRHSRVLVEGWYLDTNISLERMRRVLHAAVRASGLQWGQDIKVQWKSTRSSIG